MKRIALACAVAMFAAAGADRLHGQGGGNPFIDHSEIGRAHV